MRIYYVIAVVLFLLSADFICHLRCQCQRFKKKKIPSLKMPSRDLQAKKAPLLLIKTGELEEFNVLYIKYVFKLSVFLQCLSPDLHKVCIMKILL